MWSGWQILNINSKHEAWEHTSHSPTSNMFYSYSHKIMVCFENNSVGFAFHNIIAETFKRFWAKSVGFFGHVTVTDSHTHSTHTSCLTLVSASWGHLVVVFWQDELLEGKAEVSTLAEWRQHFQVTVYGTHKKLLAICSFAMRNDWHYNTVNCQKSLITVSSDRY